MSVPELKKASVQVHGIATAASEAPPPESRSGEVRFPWNQTLIAAACCVKGSKRSGRVKSKKKSFGLLKYRFYRSCVAKDPFQITHVFLQSLLKISTVVTPNSSKLVSRGINAQDDMELYHIPIAGWFILENPVKMVKIWGTI